MNSHLGLLSWNVKGLNHPVKKRKVLSHLKQLRAQIAFLQETHICSSDNHRSLSGWMGQRFHSSFQAKARGVSVLISQDISFEPHNVISDRSGRYVIVSGRLYNTLVVFVNVYAPNVDDVGFFEHLFSLFPDLNTYALILGGDLNCWLDPVLDRSSTNPSTVGRSARFIQAFLSNYGVCDVWRFLHPGNREYSFSSHVHHTYSRIDYFFIDNNLIPLVHSCIYQSIVISDHAPVVLTMSLPGLPQKITQWRFNSTLLSDDSFVKFMEKEIAFFLTTNMSLDMSSLYVWDALKAYLQGQIVAYTAQMKQKSYKERADLAHQIREIDKHYTQCVQIFIKNGWNSRPNLTC